MKTIVYACVAVLVLAVPGPLCAQASVVPSEASQDGTIPITQLIAAVAKKTGKKFVVDPRVRADVAVGQDFSSIGYGEFLAVLQVHGFAAVESGGYVRVVPDANARQLPIPLVSGKEVHPDAQYVTRIIPVRSMPAAMLVPLLRPLIPQQGHLVAVTCSNVLLIADTFGNVRRIESVVQALDTGKPYEPDNCAVREPVASKDGAANR